MSQSIYTDKVVAQSTALAKPVVVPFWQQIGFFYWGILFVCFGFAVYTFSILLSIVRLLSLQTNLFIPTIQKLLWVSGVPTTLGIVLIALDLGLLLPVKRRMTRRSIPKLVGPAAVTVALTAYNDEASIFD